MWIALLILVPVGILAAYTMRSSKKNKYDYTNKPTGVPDVSDGVYKAKSGVKNIFAKVIRKADVAASNFREKSEPEIAPKANVTANYAPIDKDAIAIKVSSIKERVEAPYKIEPEIKEIISNSNIEPEAVRMTQINKQRVEEVTDTNFIVTYSLPDGNFSLNEEEASIPSIKMNISEDSETLNKIPEGAGETSFFEPKEGIQDNEGNR